MKFCPKPVFDLFYGFFLLSLILVAGKSTAQGGLLAEFYDGHNFDEFVSSKYVENIDLSWNHMPPVEGVNPNDCSIRWTGKLKPARTATYLFAAQVDDGIRVWIDGEIIINQWELNDLGIFDAEKKLVANEEYDIKVEYFNALYEGEIKLLWDIKKAKEDLSWSEYFFGAKPQYQVIHSDYFVRAKEEVVESEEATPLAKSVKFVETEPIKRQEKPKAKPRKVVKEVVEPEPEKVEVVKVDPVVQKEVMTITKAKAFIPKNVEFVRSKSEILHASYKELNVFANFMLDNPEFSVMIEGHTDVIGDHKLNQILSEERAQKIAEYLIEKGINSSRIEKAGFGGSQPLKVLGKNKPYAPNRRVVFKLHKVEEVLDT